MNESMGDEVKITVIATGFQRENLPAIERKGQRGTEPPVVSEPVPQMRIPEPEYEPEPEAVVFEPAPPEPVYEEPPKAAAAAANGSAEPLFDDIDVPAILRRDRRMIQ
jgi:hypothetical protein